MYTIDLDRLLNGMPVWASPPPTGQHPRELGNCLKSLMGRGQPVNFATQYAGAQGDKVKEWLKALGVENAEVLTAPNGQVIWDEMEIVMDDNGQLLVKKRTEDGIEITKYQPVSIETKPIEEVQPMSDGLKGLMAFSDMASNLLEEAGQLLLKEQETLAAINPAARIHGNKIKVNEDIVPITSDNYQDYSILHTNIPLAIDDLDKRFKLALSAKLLKEQDPEQTSKIESFLAQLRKDAIDLRHLDYVDVQKFNDQWMKDSLLKVGNELKAPALLTLAGKFDELSKIDKPELFKRAMNFARDYGNAIALLDKADKSKTAILSPEVKQGLIAIRAKLDKMAQGDIPEKVLDDKETLQLMEAASAFRPSTGDRQYEDAKRIWDAKTPQEQLSAVLSGDPKKLPDVLRRAGYVNVDGILTQGLADAMKHPALADLQISARTLPEPDKRLIIANGPTFVDMLNSMPANAVPVAEIPGLFMRFVRGERAGVTNDLRRLYGVRGKDEAKPAVNIRDIYDRVKANGGTAQEKRLVEKVDALRTTINESAEIVKQVPETEREKIWQDAYKKAQGFTELRKEERRLLARIAKEENAINTGKYPGMPAMPRKPTVSDFTKGDVVAKRKAALAAYNAQLRQAQDQANQAKSAITQSLATDRAKLAEVTKAMDAVRDTVTDQERAVWQNRRAKQELVNVVGAIEPEVVGKPGETARRQEAVARDKAQKEKDNAARLQSVMSREVAGQNAFTSEVSKAFAAKTQAVQEGKTQEWITAWKNNPLRSALLTQAENIERVAQTVASDDAGRKQAEFAIRQLRALEEDEKTLSAPAEPPKPEEKPAGTPQERLASAKQAWEDWLGIYKIEDWKTEHPNEDPPLLVALKTAFLDAQSTLPMADESDLGKLLTETEALLAAYEKASPIATASSHAQAISSMEKQAQQREEDAVIAKQKAAADERIAKALQWSLLSPAQKNRVLGVASPNIAPAIIANKFKISAEGVLGQVDELRGALSIAENFSKISASDIGYVPLTTKAINQSETLMASIAQNLDLLSDVERKRVDALLGLGRNMLAMAEQNLQTAQEIHKRLSAKPA